MTVRLVLPLPNEGGPGLEAQFGDIIENLHPSQITLLKPAGSENGGEDAPDWLMRLVNSRMPDEPPSIHVLKTLPLDPGEYGWNHDNYLSTHFEPIAGSEQEGVETVFLCGMGSSWLSNFMTSLAISSGCEILVSSPEDVDGIRAINSITFIKSGLGHYRKLFDGKGITHPPSRNHHMQRNLLVRLLLNEEEWSDAYGLSGPEYLPVSLGVRRSMEPLIRDGLVEVGEGDTSYRLTPSGLVCAVETRKHHLWTLESDYHDGESTARMRGELTGLVMSMRSMGPEAPVSAKASVDDLNRVRPVVYDRLSAFICNLSDSGDSRRIEVTDPESEQPCLFSAVQERGEVIESSFISICCPGWSPEDNFRDTLRFLMGLDSIAEWKIDITKITQQERVIVSACSYLLGMEAVYTMRRDENVPISRTTITLPGYLLWRMISDYNMGHSLSGGAVDLARALDSPTGTADRESYNKVLERQVTSLRRIDKDLTKQGIFRRISGDSWELTDAGKGLRDYLRAKGG